MRGGAVAEAIFAHGLCLPSGSSLSPADQARVVDGVRAVLAPGSSAAR
jgi:pyridoxal phosphate-dependent aminotransferase EpsN